MVMGSGWRIDGEKNLSENLSESVYPIMEECWFIYGKKIGSCWIGRLKYHSRGAAASVDFDWSLATNKNIIGFYHSHPGGCPEPSTRDDKTMSAWVRAEGRSLLCGIFGHRDHKCYVYRKNNHGNMVCFLINAKIVDNFFFAWE